MTDTVRALCKVSMIRTTLCVTALLHLLVLQLHVFAAPRVAKPRGPKKTPLEIKEKLLKYNVIPDVIPATTYPRKEIQVVWPKAKVNFGNLIPALYTKQAPNVTWPKSKGQVYTLLMVDPDRDKATEFKDHEYQIWLVGNIYGTNISSGKAITDYIPLIKPRSLDFHRYILLVFKHPNKTEIEFDEPRLISDSDAFRAHFRTAKFMKKYGFKNAYAINFFLGEWSDWTPEDESDSEDTETDTDLKTTLLEDEEAETEVTDTT